ncbi:MAG: ABC transporter permease [Gemmatimonadetes bacterium]|nr:ABC transporter permease [Gemmatimonadota bacterium]
MHSALSDLCYGVRTLSRDKGSALVAITTLALGIGLCTTTFSLVYGVFLRGLDVPAPDRIQLIARNNPSRNIDFMSVSQPDFYDWRERQRSFEGLASFTGGFTMNLSDSLGPERFEGSYVSANLFDLLRVRPVIGSTFRPEDDRPGAPLTVLLSHSVWTNRYGGDSAIVGRTVKVNGEHATIIGVMRRGFRFPDDKVLWVAQRDERARTPNRQGGLSFQVMGRLRDGVTWDQAKAEMATIAVGLARDYPQTNEGVGVAFRTFVESDTGPQITAVFGGMQVATLFVLLIACANVANLLLARATVRTREAAVRTAIGASPLRVVSPFFAETLVLAAGGALLGTGIAAVGVELFDRATQDVGKPYYMVFALDAPILAFVVGITVFTALAAGIAPALQILRTDVGSTLKDESRGSSGVMGGRVSRVLVVAQMALSCALLVGAGLMVKSVVKLRNYRFAFATENVFTARLGLFDAVYPDTLSRQRFWRALHERLRTVPGAAAAALTSSLPGGGGGGGRVAIEGQTYAKDQDYPASGSAAITPGFFETFDVAMLQGRAFTDQDHAGSLPVAIVNQEFADRYFLGVSPLGRRIRPGASTSTQSWYAIVGVAPTLVVRGLDPDNLNPAEYYLPVAQRDPRFLSIAVRSSAGDGLMLASAARQAVRSLDPDLPLYDVFTMLGSIRNRTWFFNVFGTVFIVFGAAALFMASVGLYGLLAFSVSRRVREMGIRMALGASAGDVLRMILGQGARQTAVGLTIGLVLAFALSRLVRIIMFEVEPSDPLVFGSIGLVIAMVGLAASWVPARRATAVDPMVALRYE